MVNYIDRLKELLKPYGTVLCRTLRSAMCGSLVMRDGQTSPWLSSGHAQQAEGAGTGHV